MKKKKVDRLGYNDALQELETIAASLEEDSLDIDQLSEEVNRALALIGHCRKKLRTTEEAINKSYEEGDTND